MSKNITKEEINRVREAIDIVDVIAAHVVLKKEGKLYAGLSPWNNEKTPSFKVDPQKQNYHCYSSNQGGDVFEFMMKHPLIKKSFKEAVLELAAKAGITLESQKEASTPRVFKDRLVEINEWACQYFQSQFGLGGEGSPGMEQMVLRGMSENIMRKLRIGYSLPGYTNLLSTALRQGFSKPELQYAGLIKFNKSHEEKRNSGKYYDAYRDRIMFPIFNEKGQCVTFGSRVIASYNEDTNTIDNRENEAKYLNGHNNTLYKKNKVLYGLNWAKQAIKIAEKTFVVEGYMDAAALYEVDIWNTVATCGTAFTPYYAQALKRYCSHVILVFDPDKAGMEAMHKAGDVLLGEGHNVEFCILPSFVNEQGKIVKTDPHDFLTVHKTPKEGAEAFQNYVTENKKSFLDYLIENYYQKVNGPQEKANGIKHIAKTLMLVRDELLAGEYVKYASEKMNINPNDMRSEIAEAKRKRFVKIQKLNEVREKIASTAGKGEKELIRLLLRFFDWQMGPSTFGERVIADVGEYDFTDNLMGNIFDCVEACASNALPINETEIGKINRRAGEDASKILNEKFIVTDLSRSVPGPGMQPDMAMLLNGYKQWLIQKRVADLKAKGITRTPHEEQVLVYCDRILQEFKVAII